MPFPPLSNSNSNSNSKLKLIAHRGGPKYAPENTLAAFRNALALGVDGYEFDVQMTKDGELVIMHDETVDRTTNGSGAVKDLTLAQIRALDAGQGEPPATFQEALDLARSAGVWMLAEIKSPHLYPGIEAKALNALTAADYLDRTLIMSFDWKSLETVRRLSPTAKIGALYDEKMLTVSKAPAGAQYACPLADLALLNPFLIGQAHRQGRQVFAWFWKTENPLMYRLLNALGVDGLIADDPLAVKKTLRL